MDNTLKFSDKAEKYARFRPSYPESFISYLMEEAGVDTVVELAQRNAENLLAKIQEVNAAKKLVRRIPTLAQIQNWIEQAKSLPRAIHY